MSEMVTIPRGLLERLYALARTCEEKLAHRHDAIGYEIGRPAQELRRDLDRVLLLRPPMPRPTSSAADDDMRDRLRNGGRP